MYEQSTGKRIMVGSWFGEISSCCWLHVLPGSAWVLLKYVDFPTFFFFPVVTFQKIFFAHTGPCHKFLRTLWHGFSNFRYRAQKNDLQIIFKKDPGRAKQKSQGTAGRNFTKPGTSHFFGLCTCYKCD